MRHGRMQIAIHAAAMAGTGSAGPLTRSELGRGGVAQAPPAAVHGPAWGVAVLLASPEARTSRPATKLIVAHAMKHRREDTPPAT